MPDQPRIEPNSDDAEFRDWLNNRKPSADEVAPSVTFMEIMRQAASKQSAAAPLSDLDAAADWTPQPSLSPLPTFDDGTPAHVLSGDSTVPDVDDSTQARRRRLAYREKRATGGAVPIGALSPADIPPDALQTTEVVEAVPTDTAPDAVPPASADPRMKAAKAAKPPKTPIDPPPRRAARRSSRSGAGVVGGFVRSFILVFAAAGIMATIFTWWTPSRFIRASVSEQLSIALETQTNVPGAGSTAPPTPNREIRIGIVAGHRGPQNDPGAVCPDGLTEAEITFNVAQLVVASLQNIGYTVDLLDEFDQRLNNYQAAALVSIHANTCQDYGERVSGYLISAAAARVTARSVDDLLVECVARHYLLQTALERRIGVTRDMTDYHSFREIHPQTPATIIELGFLRGDRELLTERPDLMSRGITDGILCFLQPARPTSTPPPTVTPTLEATP